MTTPKKELTKEQRHILLVESAWGLLEEQFKEVLKRATLEGEALPSEISVPFQAPSGDWVRLTLEISRLRKDGDEGDT